MQVHLAYLKGKICKINENCINEQMLYSKVNLTFVKYNKMDLPLGNKLHKNNMNVSIHWCNDWELACLERVETSSKTFKTCVLTLPNCLYQAQY